MTYHMHLRALPPTEVQRDGEWVEAFMEAAWRNYEEEYETGVTWAIEKQFDGLAHLYTGIPDGRFAGDPSGLPVFGGESIPYPLQGGPPFLIMMPEQVQAAWEFLDGASFDALWAASGPALSEHWPDAGSVYRDHHRRLSEFYEDTARCEEAMIKAFWY